MGCWARKARLVCHHLTRNPNYLMYHHPNWNLIDCWCCHQMKMTNLSYCQCQYRRSMIPSWSIHPMKTTILSCCPYQCRRWKILSLKWCLYQCLHSTNLNSLFHLMMTMILK